MGPTNRVSNNNQHILHINIILSHPNPINTNPHLQEGIFMCMSLAIKFAIKFANILQKKVKKRNKPETKRDFLQEEDKDYCAFLLFIEDLYCFAVALQKKKRKKRINLVIFASLISV